MQLKSEIKYCLIFCDTHFTSDLQQCQHSCSGDHIWRIFFTYRTRCLMGIKLNLNHCEFGFKKEQHDDTSRNWFIPQEICKEWASGKLVEYESLRVSNGRVGSSRLKNGQIASRYASIYWKISIFQCQIPCDYWNSRVRVRSSSKKIVECESVMRIYGYSPIP